MARQHHAIDVQISVHVRQPKNGRPLTDNIIRQAILYRAENGEDAPGFTCRLVRWRHTMKKGSRWIYGDDEERAWSEFARWLQFGKVSINTTLR